MTTGNSVADGLEQYLYEYDKEESDPYGRDEYYEDFYEV